LLFFTGINPASLYMIQVASVLIFMTIDAEIFPVTSVRRVIVMIVVLVVNGQQVQVFVCKLAAAPGAYPGMDFQ